MTGIAKLICISLLVVSGFVNASEVDVSGIWSDVNRTKGGLGSQWKLSENGAATYTFGAVVDFRYEANGNKMKMTFVNADDTTVPESPTQEFLVKGDRLTINPDNAERRQDMKRTGSELAKQPLVGEWTYKHYTGGPAFMRFTSNGTGQLVVPMKSAEGTYRRENGNGRIKLGSDLLSFVAQNSDSLLIRDAQGKESTFRRFK